MKFIKYNSIDNVTNKELMRFKESNLYDPSATWYVLEKVHGCLDENTVIQTSVGGKSIKQICEEYPNIDYQIKSYNVDTKTVEYVDCTNVSVQDNINNWFLITLEDGTNLVVTANHKIYLPEHNCYCQVDQLQIGDLLLVTEK